MHQSYRDIREKLGEPVWWDEYGVPRYCQFQPRCAANIYAHEVTLLEIACQACGRLFHVADAGNILDFSPDRPTLRQAIENGTIHYGDPPNVGCCPAGATMNCEDLRVLEYWYKDYTAGIWDWTRVPELEVWLPDSQRSGEWGQKDVINE